LEPTLRANAPQIASLLKEGREMAGAQGFTGGGHGTTGRQGRGAMQGTGGGHGETIGAHPEPPNRPVFSGATPPNSCPNLASARRTTVPMQRMQRMFDMLIEAILVYVV
jgi:hypothetical protein